MKFTKFLGALGFITMANLSAASYETTTTSADCKERNCFYDSIGIGVAYYNFNAGDVISPAYYLVGDGKYVWSARAQVGLLVRAGMGSNQLKGTLQAGLKNNASYFFLDAKLKAGWNVLSKDYPLFLNVFGEIVSQTPKKSFGRAYSVVGLELDGNIPMGGNLKLTYGASYGVLFASYFYDNVRSNVPNSASNFEASANVGINYEFSNGYAYFARIIGRYQNIGASNTATYNGNSVSYPKSSNYAGMLEMGVEF